MTNSENKSSEGTNDIYHHEWLITGTVCIIGSDKKAILQLLFLFDFKRPTSTLSFAVLSLNHTTKHTPPLSLQPTLSLLVTLNKAPDIADQQLDKRIPGCIVPSNPFLGLVQLKKK